MNNQIFITMLDMATPYQKELSEVVLNFNNEYLKTKWFLKKGNIITKKELGLLFEVSNFLYAWLTDDFDINTVGISKKRFYDKQRLLLDIQDVLEHFEIHQEINDKIIKKMLTRSR